MHSRGSLALLLVVACSRSQAMPAPAPSASSSASGSAALPSVEFGETDFRGAFNGAKLVATLVAKSGAITGTCFYESVGTDIPLRGTVAPDGSIVVSELDGDKAVSTITLTRAADGALSGTWTKGDKSGAATLLPITRKAGEPVVIVTRPETDKSLAICGWDGHRFTSGNTEKPAAPCFRKASAPVVLGLSDRAFEKTLDAALLASAKMNAFDNPVGVGVTVDYHAVLNARGVLSIVFDAKYSCGAGVKDCDVDAYAPGHNYGHETGFVVAIDGAAIAKSPADFIDLKKARAVIKPITDKGYAMCVASGTGDPLQEVMGAVLDDTGVRIEHDQCSNHVHTDQWDVIPYPKLDAALKNDSPFSAAWKH